MSIPSARFFFLLAFFELASCGGKVVDRTPAPPIGGQGGSGGAGGTGNAPGGNGSGTEPGAGSGVTAAGGIQLVAPFEGTIDSMAVDDDAIYLGMEDGRILRAPKTGAPTVEIAGRDTATYPEGLVVDADYVYYTSLSRGEVGRVAKAGGAPPETLVRDQERPYQLAIDATHLYWVNEGDAVAGGSGHSGQVVRRAIAGGNVEVVADRQQSPEAIQLSGDYVYFARGPWGDVNGAICRVPKAGGSVDFLVERLSTTYNFAAVGGDVYFVDYDSSELRLAAGGGGVKKVAWPASRFGITPMGAGALYATVDRNRAEIRWATGAGEGTLVFGWTLPSSTFSWYAPARVMAFDGSRVYWVEELFGPAGNQLASAVNAAPRP